MLLSCESTRLASLVLAIGVLLTGCESSQSSPSKPTGADCQAQLADLKQWMGKLEAEGAGCRNDWVSVGEAVALERPPNGSNCDVPVVALDANRATLDGSQVASTATLARGEHSERLEELIVRKDKLRASFQRPPHKQYALVIAADVPWSAVAALVQQLSSVQREEVTFLFASKSSLAEPSGTKAIEEMKAASAPVDPSKPARKLSTKPGVGPRVFSRCGEVDKRLEPLATASATPEQKRARVHAAILEGLGKCSCQANVEDVKGYVWAQMGRFSGPPTYGAVVALAQTGDTAAKTVTKASDTPWRDAHEAVVAAAGSKDKYRFEVKP